MQVVGTYGIFDGGHVELVLFVEGVGCGLYQLVDDAGRGCAVGQLLSSADVFGLNIFGRYQKQMEGSASVAINIVGKLLMDGQ